MELELTNVVEISVSEAQAGIGAYNTSNASLFTSEVPGMSFGTLGYSLYLAPTQVGVDFGTDSETFKMANAIFSQQPNILAGGGYLAVILFADSADVPAVQNISFSTAPTTGNYQLKYGVTGPTGNIGFGATAANIQTALRLLSGLGSVTVADGLVGGTFDVTFHGVSGPATLLTVVANSLQDTDGIDVVVTVVTTTPGTVLSTETLGEAVSRTKDLVQYFGVAQVGIASSDDVLAAAAVIQPLNKIGFFVSKTLADIEGGGTLDMLTTGGFTQSRGLYYGTDTNSKALVMMASYMGRALSTNFSGSNTTQTMHLKDLTGVQPDPTMTQSILNLAIAAGADTYVSLQGVAKVFCSGANSFYDQVYNLRWLVGALQVAGFNYLAQSSTKIPQTESGMDGLKGAYRNVCEQGVTNQYGAPGSWNSSTMFGNQVDFLQNIAQRGYYIYSIPISQQSQVDRAARKAPLVQIAFKEAGAIQSSTVIVNINA